MHDIVLSASSGGVRLRPRCLESCVLTCYWGCAVQGLQEALQSHQHGVRISTPHKFEEALHSDYQHHQTFLYPAAWARSKQGRLDSNSWRKTGIIKVVRKCWFEICLLLWIGLVHSWRDHNHTYTYTCFIASIFISLLANILKKLQFDTSCYVMKLLCVCGALHSLILSPALNRGTPQRDWATCLRIPGSEIWGFCPGCATPWWRCWP